VKHVRSASNSESEVDADVDSVRFAAFARRSALAARRTVLATKKNATPKNFFFFFFFNLFQFSMKLIFFFNSVIL
jgi:hypothetical protein